jgi:hypothetical protein
MSFKSNVSTIVAALVASITFQNVVADPAYASGNLTVAGHHRLPPPVTILPMDNVKSFGAMGDGVTDDTAAIQNAANDAANKHIGVFFPPGAYLYAGFIQFNGVAVTGSGSASFLHAASNSSNCGIVLTGTAPSIQNMVLSTVGTPAGGNPSVVVFNATSFTLANDTFLQGPNYTAVRVQSSSVGAINACTFDASGAPNDAGVIVEACQNFSIVNSLFQNEAVGVVVDPANPSQSIALLSNTIGNVTFPTKIVGILAGGVTTLDIAQNTIQMASSSSGVLPIEMNLDDNFNVSNNNTWGGQIGILVQGSGGTTSNMVSQNLIHNCGNAGIQSSTFLLPTAIQIMSNQFGECGMSDTGNFISNAVILVTAPGVAGANIFIQNNSYQGHFNGLDSYVTSTITGPNIPPSHVTGNTVTQAVGLPNNI